MSFQPGANVYTQGFGSRPEDVEVPHIDVRAPSTTDVAVVGKRWIYKNNGEYINLGNSSSASGTTSNWALVGTVGGDLDTLTASTGGALIPVANNLNIFGTASQVTTAGSGDTITVSLPAAIVAPGSLATTTTLASGTTLTAGSSLAVTTSATVGTTLGVTGATTLAGLTQVGTANINASGAGVTTIGTGGTGAVNIGNATGNTAVTGTLTTSAGITATTGNIVASAGNISTTVGGITSANGITATTGNIVATAGNITTSAGSITSATTLTATLGNITATNGDLVLSAAGNKLKIHASATATDSAGMFVLAGSNPTVVACTAVTADSIILLTPQTKDGSNPATVGVVSKTAGVGFSVESTDSGDQSYIGYLIIN